MKKNLLLITAFLVALASCSDDDFFWSQPENLRVVIRPENVTGVAFKATDTLAVIDETGVQVPFYVETTGSSSSTYYSYKWTGSKPEYAVYPEPDTTIAGKVCMCVEPVQTAKAGAQCPVFAAIGKLTGSRNIYKSQTMINAMGIIMVTVDKPSVKSISIESLGDEYVAGNVTVDYDRLAAGEDFWEPVVSADPKREFMYKSVTLTPEPGSDVCTADGSFVQGDYYIAVLPQTYSQGLKVTAGTDVKTRDVPLTIGRNAVFDIDDLFPDEIILSLPFMNDANVNPLGAFISWADQTASGVDYAFEYSYEYGGKTLRDDFIFTIYGGSRYSYEAKVSGIGKKLLYVNIGGLWAIRLPAIRGRYLKSVSFTHTGTTYARNFRLQEGYPTAGHYYTVNATPASVTALATATVSIPTGATLTAQINETKAGTAYFVQLTGAKQAYYITDITVTYTKQKPTAENNNQ